MKILRFGTVMSLLLFMYVNSHAGEVYFPSNNAAEFAGPGVILSGTDELTYYQGDPKANADLGAIFNSTASYFDNGKLYKKGTTSSSQGLDDIFFKFIPRVEVPLYSLTGLSSCKFGFVAPFNTQKLDSGSNPTIVSYWSPVIKLTKSASEKPFKLRQIIFHWYPGDMETENAVINAMKEGIETSIRYVYGNSPEEVQNNLNNNSKTYYAGRAAQYPRHIDGFADKVYIDAFNFPEGSNTIQAKYLRVKVTIKSIKGGWFPLMYGIRVVGRWDVPFNSVTANTVSVSTDAFPINIGSSGSKRSYVLGDNEGVKWYKTTPNGPDSGQYRGNTRVLGEFVKTPDRLVEFVDTVTSLNVNTYLHAIRPHEPKDVDTELKDFEKLTGEFEKRGVDVIAYFMPPSEGCAPSSAGSAPLLLSVDDPGVPPYYCDFKSWAFAIGMIAKKHRNLKAVAIDDFSMRDPSSGSSSMNIAGFEPVQERVGGFVKILKSYGLKFYALTYYQDIGYNSNEGGNPNFDKDSRFNPDFIANHLYPKCFTIDAHGIRHSCLDGIIVPYINVDHLSPKDPSNYLIYSQDPENDGNVHNDLPSQIARLTALYGKYKLPVFIMVYNGSFNGNAYPRRSDVCSVTKTAMDQAEKGNIAGVFQYGTPKMCESCAHCWPKGHQIPGYDLIRVLYDRH